MTDQEAPLVRPSRYFEAVNSDEAEVFRHFGEGVLLAFAGNMENGIPPYVIVGGTMHALARFLVATLEPGGSDDILDGMVATFGRMVEAAKRARAMDRARGATRQ